MKSRVVNLKEEEEMSTKLGMDICLQKL